MPIPSTLNRAVVAPHCAASADVPAVWASLRPARWFALVKTLPLPMLFLAAAPASATDLLNNLQAPAFGGSNGAALTAAQYGQTLKQQAAATAAAIAKAPVATDPNAAFVQAITSQLTGLVAETIAQKIANSQNGQAGTIQSGGVVITYVNSDGELTVQITTPSGTSSLTIPVGGGG